MKEVSSSLSTIEMAITLLSMTFGLVAVLAATPISGGTLNGKFYLKYNSPYMDWFLCRGTIENENLIVAQPNVYDNCVFEPFLNNDGTYSFKADNDMYLGRVENEMNEIAAIKKSIDRYSKFHVNWIAESTDYIRVYIRADNGKLLECLSLDFPLEAVGEVVDEYTTFIIMYDFLDNKIHSSGMVGLKDASNTTHSSGIVGPKDAAVN